MVEETIKWGLCSVAVGNTHAGHPTFTDSRKRTTKFINEEAMSIHGSLRASSIFLSDSGEWKVGGFDLLSSIKDEDAVIYVCWMRSLKAQAMQSLTKFRRIAALSQISPS